MHLGSTPASGVGANQARGLSVWLRTPLHPGKRGGGQPGAGVVRLVTNPAPPRQAGWGPPCRFMHADLAARHFSPLESSGLEPGMVRLVSPFHPADNPSP